MKTVKRNIYIYAVLNDFDNGFTFQVTTTSGMDVESWLLVDEKEVCFDVDELDYIALLKQKKIDDVLAKQEAINAELLELTS